MICGRTGNRHGDGRGTCRGDEDALVLGVLSLSKGMCCDFEARFSHCAERLPVDILAAGEALAMVSGGGVMEASAHSECAGISIPKHSRTTKGAMNVRLGVAR